MRVFYKKRITRIATYMRTSCMRVITASSACSEPHQCAVAAHVAAALAAAALPAALLGLPYLQRNIFLGGCIFRTCSLQYDFLYQAWVR